MLLSELCNFIESHLENIIIDPFTGESACKPLLIHNQPWFMIIGDGVKGICITLSDWSDPTKKLTVTTAYGDINDSLPLFVDYSELLAAYPRIGNLFMFLRLWGGTWGNFFGPAKLLWWYSNFDPSDTRCVVVADNQSSFFLYDNYYRRGLNLQEILFTLNVDSGFNGVLR